MCFVADMNAIIFIVGGFIIAQAAAARKCDNLGVLVYEDMNCKPVSRSTNGCPSKFDCPDIRKSEDTCYFRGESYAVDQFVRANTFCDIGCICVKNDVSVKFVCAASQCGEFGPPLPPNCYYNYTLEACCGKEHCPPANHAPFKCTFDGVEYEEGQRFFPKDSCSMCVCQKGFKGKIEAPFCKPRQCDGQIKHQDKIQKSCAPVYNRREDLDNGILCCPTLYTCPENEVIEGTPTSTEECNYGNKTLKVGQGFKKEILNVVGKQSISCKCQVPPLVTCVLEI